MGFIRQQNQTKFENPCGLVRTTYDVDLLFAQSSLEINLLAVTLLPPVPLKLETRQTASQHAAVTPPTAW